MESVEANRALYYRFVTLVSGGDLDGLDEVLSADFVDHSLPAGAPPGPEGLKRLLAAARGNGPERQTAIEDLVAEGDRVVGRVRRRMQRGGVVPGVLEKCRTESDETIEIVRITGGRIIERWGQSGPAMIEPSYGY